MKSTKTITGTEFKEILTKHKGATFAHVVVFGDEHGSCTKDKKKVLLLSDTGNPYKYLINFIPELINSKIYIYVSPASTSKFIRLFVKQSLNKKVKIIKDKNFSMFYNNKIKDYYVCIFLAKTILKKQQL